MVVGRWDQRRGAREAGEGEGGGAEGKQDGAAGRHGSKSSLPSRTMPGAAMLTAGATLLPFSPWRAYWTLSVATSCSAARTSALCSAGLTPMNALTILPRGEIRKVLRAESFFPS